MNYFTSIKRTKSIKVDVYDATYELLEFDAQVEMQRIFDGNGNDVGSDIYCSDNKGYKLKANISLIFSQLTTISSASGKIVNGVTLFPLKPSSNENIAIVNGDTYFMEVQLMKFGSDVTVDFVFRKQEYEKKLIVLEFKQKDFGELAQNMMFKK